MRISDWSSDVCSSDLQVIAGCVETIEFRVCALLLDDKHIDAQFQQCVERGRVDFIPGIPAPVEVQLPRDSLSAGSEGAAFEIVPAAETQQAAQCIDRVARLDEQLGTGKE